MTSRTDARNVTTSYDYDPLGRLRRTTHSTSSADDVAMAYDDASNVTLVSSQNGGAFEYQYDELDRVTVQTWTFGGQRYETRLHYDSAGCLDTVTYPTGSVLSMTCDTAGRVESILAGGTPIVTDVVHHPSGHPSAVTYGNGVSTVFGIDDRGRVGSVTAQGVLDLQYGYDGADNVVSINDGNDPISARSMTYDPADRLSTVTADGMWGVVLYEYDELGNRTRKQRLGTSVSYDYDASNRLVGASEAPAHGRLTLTWDDEGRLAWSSDGASYRYDGRGRRVTKSEAAQTTLYHYDPSGRVIAETLPDGTKLRDYIYLGNQLVAVDGCISTSAPPCNERQWYHTDTLGSAVARTDASGAVVARLAYEPWGEEWSHQGEPGDRQYNGRVYDAGTGFHDYGARLYWPEIGRFVSADTNLGHIENPASLNRYSYVLNNPYKYVDPTGRETQVVIIHSRVMGVNVGYHAALRVDNGGGGQPVLFDPGGSYHYGDEPRGSGGYFEGKEADLGAFTKWQKEDGDNPVVYRFNTTPEEEALIASRFGYSPDPSKDSTRDPGAGNCSKTVSTAVSGVGPFKKVRKGTIMPGNLEDDLKAAQKDQATAKPEPPQEKKQP